MINISAERLQQIVEKVFVGAGAPVGSARQVSTSLVENNLVGHDSHGVLRVDSYVQALDSGRVDPHGVPTIRRESATTALIDGGCNFGQIVACQAMDLAMKKARAHDIGMVALRNCGHTGRIGEYVVRAAQGGFMGLAFGSGSARGGAVAPYMGTSRVFNTNPIAWGVPAGAHPPVFMDYATSAASWGKIRAAVDKGVSIPEGWLLNADGRPTTDPRDQQRGGIMLPFGQHKGYGILFMVEALSGGLTGVSCAALDSYKSEFAMVLMAVNIEAFQPLEQFCAMMDELIVATKAARKAPGAEEILVPGEIEWKTREQRLRDGIDVPEAAWERIVEAGAAHGVTVTL
ncbi:MAG TPA: Ldh family oxidoreductase [Chloroflexi bacterium]|nr:Ldh family oxidoreductase [Chloroflexota bacterium]